MRKEKHLIFKVSDMVWLGLVTYTLVITLINSTTNHKRVIGDVNQDGKVSISDMAIVKSHILGNSELTYEQMDLADVNNDALIDVIDILEIRRIILSKDSN